MSSTKVPRANESERYVAAALLNEWDEFWPEVQEIVRPEIFFSADCRVAVDAAHNLWNNGHPVDAASVCQTHEVRRSEIGSDKILGLSGEYLSGGNILYHAKQVEEAFLRRKAMTYGRELIGRASEGLDPIEEIYAETSDRLATALQGHEQQPTSLADYAAEYVSTIEEGRRGKSPIKCHLPEIDDMTGGFQKKNLTIVAARPSVGKSVFGTNNIALPAAMNGVGTGIFSLEMSKQEILDRFMGYLLGVSLPHIRDGRLTQLQKDDIKRAVSRIADFPIHVDDEPGLTVEQIRARAKRWASLYGIRLIVIDYLQLMAATDPRLSRNHQIEHMTKSLKGLAKEIDGQVILLSQLTRENERAERPPRLSDLRDSGAIEQDADLVIFIHRMRDTASGLIKQHGSVILAKQRNGPTGMTNIKLNDRRMTIDEADAPMGGIKEEDLF